MAGTIPGAGITTPLTLTTADNLDTLTLVSTDADANVGPNLNLYRNSASPADNDHGGEIAFNAKNDAGEIIKYGKIRLQTDDVSDGAETGRFDISTMFAGSEISRFMIKSDEIVVNQNGVDFDFRIESDSITNLFNLQAVNGYNSAGTIGFNSANADGNFIEAVNPQGGAYAAKFDSSASSGAVYLLSIKFSGQSPDDNNSYMINGRDSSTGWFVVYADGDVQNHDNSYGAISDERIKQGIKDANSQWDDIKALKVRNYKKNDDVEKYGDKAWEQIGVIAQELEASGMDKCVKKEILYTADDQDTKDYLYTQKDKDQGLIPEGKDVGDVQIAKKANVGDIKEYKTVKYSILYMKAIKALQEAMTRIETLETKVAALESA